MDKNINEKIIRPQKFGVGFIKSRKSTDKVMEFAERMLDRAEKVKLPLLQIIVDDGSSEDVDRDKVTELCNWMEKDYIKVVFVQKATDITNDRDDLEAMLIKARNLGVIIYAMDIGHPVCYKPDAE